MALKLFHVSSTIEIDMVVLADDEAQARRLGELNWREEMSNAGLRPDSFTATKVEDRRQVEWMGDENLSCVTPYGPEDRTYESGCSSPQRSIDEYLAEQIEREATEREISEKQVTLDQLLAERSVEKQEVEEP